MPSKSKSQIIEELKADVEMYRTRLDETTKLNHALIVHADKAFANSSYKRQLEENLSFYKKLESLGRSQYDHLKASAQRQFDAIQKVLKDNQTFAEANGFKYEIGMITTAPCDIEAQKLLDKNIELVAKLENREEYIETLLTKIQDLQREKADLKEHCYIGK